MNSARKLTVALAALVAVSAGNAMSAQPESRKASAQLMSPNERGALAHAFVKKWGPYAQQVYGVDVGTWASRMVGTFTTADPTNFKRSLQRSTYEGAMATLDGAGHKISDAQVIDALAQAEGPISEGDLGDTTNDLVFTPLEACRIVDTRLTGAGKIAAGTSRGFYAWGFGSFTAQGGSATDCGGLSAESPEAIVVNITAVGQTQIGYATMFPASSVSPPSAATLVYYPNVILSNASTVRLGTSGANDFKIFSERLVDYVVDIVGYYDAPHATALDCIQETVEFAAVANGARSFTTVSCPAGYTVTGGGVATGTNSGSYMNASGPNAGSTAFNNAWFSSVTNGTGAAQNYTHYASCCRVPGR
jgi:hypothetical protein